MYRTHFLSKDLQKIGEYKHYAAILSHLKNKSKTEYYNMQFSKCKDNLKQTWKLIGTLVKRKTKGQTFLARITHNNRTFTQEKDTAELLNNFFVNIRPTLAKEIKTDHTDPLQYIECFHMTSRRPYWCPKTMKRRPCWCPEPFLWELSSFLMQTLSFVSINLHRCWPRE